MYFRRSSIESFNTFGHTAAHIQACRTQHKVQIRMMGFYPLSFASCVPVAEFGRRLFCLLVRDKLSAEICNRMAKNNYPASPCKTIWLAGYVDDLCE